MQGLEQFIIATLSNLGYAGVVLFMAIESACIPLPSEVIMPFSGFLVAQGRLAFLGVVLAGGLGCTLGSAVTYWIGAYGGRPLVLRYGRYVLLSHHDVELADRWFARYGEATAFFARLLPVVRTFISLPAGIARMPFGRFLVYSFIGSVLWSALLTYVGVQLGRHWTELGPLFHRFDAVIVVGVLVLVALYVYRHVRNLRQNRHRAIAPD
ncbi:MAG: DedA family protein [Chloroflexi bacterium]|nr:DedA family protein [Chloroflexota bacterium]